MPFPFTISYDPARIAPTAVIVVRATITSGGGLLFTTTAAQRVITGGYPSHGIEIVVQPAR